MLQSPSKQEAFDALLRLKLSAFIQKTFHTVSPGDEYLHNWHIDLIAEYLEACTRREIKRLIINMPPRYMKSIAVSVAWPAWLMGHNPSEKILAASYSSKLSIKHSLDCRLMLQSEWYQRVFPGTIIAPDQNEKAKFQTTSRGHRFATSVGGSSTGEGGNFLIIDDPHNPKQALSDVQRETALTWYDQTFSSRLNDKKNGVVVLVMQRLHSNDLSGHLLEKGGWEHLSIPAVAETRTIIDFGNINIIREAGDILHPEREGEPEIEALKIALGSYAFAGQYQQRPAPAEGGIFQIPWLVRYDQPRDKYKRIVHSWDTAIKPDQINDPSCLTVWGETETRYELLQVLTKRLVYPDLKTQVLKSASEWQPDAILIEDKASGQQLLQDLKRESNLPVIGIMPDGDKITRASAVSAMFEAGKVALPKQAHWLAAYESELLTFPNAPHDDQVDSTTQFLNWVRAKSAASQIRIRGL